MQLADTLGVEPDRVVGVIARRKTLPPLETFFRTPQEHAMGLVRDYFNLQRGPIGYGNGLAGFPHDTVDELQRSLARHVETFVEIAAGQTGEETTDPVVLWESLAQACGQVWALLECLRYPAAWDTHEPECGAMPDRWRLFWARVAVLADEHKRERYGEPFELRPSRMQIWRELLCQAQRFGFVDESRQRWLGIKAAPQFMLFYYQIYPAI